MLTQLRRHGLRPVIRSLWYRTWIIDGYAGSRERPLRLMFAGYPADKAYFCRHFFTEILSDTPIGKTWSYDAATQMSRYECDLRLTPTLERPNKDESAKLVYTLPSWLGGRVNLTERDIAEGNSRSRRRDLRRLRNMGLSYRVTRSPDELSAFYSDMYEPTMAESHGDGALLMKRDHMLERLAADGCELLWVLEDNEPVAGSLIAYDQAMPRLWSSGVLNADTELKRRGVGTALYLLSFEFLFKRGFRQINIGRSRPLINDGALYFKRRFGPTLFDPSDLGYELTVASNSETALDCLATNPFVFRVGDDLHVAVFVRPERLPADGQWEAFLDQYAIPGTVRVDVNVIGSSNTKPQFQVTDHLAGRLSITERPIEQGLLNGIRQQ